MPVSIKTIEPKADVPFAKSPEFQKLQDAINQAKEALDDVSRQIVTIESKLNPSKGKPGEDAMAQTAANPSGTPEPAQTPQADQPAMGQPPMAYGDALGAPAPATNTPYRPNGRPSNFEEAIEDMRRIAGLR